MASAADQPFAHPVDPRIATAAQIPLQTFSLPKFPSEAGALKALTLTSDIKLDDYSKLLEEPFEAIPPLPAGIEALTLELFSLGYPTGFLEALSERVTNLRSLVLYSQLIGGLTTATQQDALRFFENLRSLRALHLLDVFAQPGFLKAAGIKLAGHDKGLMFLEVNYTSQPGDTDFLTRLQPAEISSLVAPSLVTCALNVAPPEQTDDPQDPTNLNEKGEPVDRGQLGITAFDKSLASDLIDSLTEEPTAPRTLKMLNCTLYTLDLMQLEKILSKHRGLTVINATVAVGPLENWKMALFNSLGFCPDLEQVEIVLNPGLPSDVLEDSIQYFPTQADLNTLSKDLTQLSSLSVNILRDKSMQSVSWRRLDDGWKDS